MFSSGWCLYRSICLLCRLLSCMQANDRLSGHEDAVKHAPQESTVLEAALTKALQLDSSQVLKESLTSLLLSELAYKQADEVAAAATELRAGLPEGLFTFERIQWSQDHVEHRYAVADSPEALYVAFVGTKQRRDYWTLAAIRQQPMWPEDSSEASAHQGFLRRARSIPIHSLYRHARRQGKRLVLTGHSLGGAVAQLCALDLLHSLPDEAPQHVACIGFAMPAVGNQALAALVHARGWERHLVNFLVPEDVISQLLSPSTDPAHPSGPPLAAAADADSVLGLTPETAPAAAPAQAAAAIVANAPQAALPRPQPALHMAARTAQAAVRLVSRPQGTYVHLGQRLYLNPADVSRSLRSPADGPPAGAAARWGKQDPIVQQRKEALGSLWMHRMPTYRARIQQICAAALQLPVSVQPFRSEGQAGRAVTHSSDVAPGFQLQYAETAPPLDCHSLPGALQWAQLLSSGLPAVKAAGQAQPRDRWLWPWVWLTQSRLFGAEQRRGGFIRVKVLLYGRGLDVSTTARVQALGEVWCDTQVVQRPEPTPRTEQEAASPEARPSLLRRRQHPVQHSRAAAGLVSRHLVAVAALLLHRLLLRPAQLMRQAQPMVLEVLVPGAVVRRLQLQQPEADATGLTVHLQSDFQSASLPVVFRQLQQQLSPTAAGLAHT
eukprot:jgi/Astpho2/7897/fgenesh1_pg.00118_%23_12_t